jgi:ligand-binding sensor domain-containing protein
MINDNDIIMTAVKEELKSFAQQIGKQLSQALDGQDVILKNMLAAMEALDARLTKVESGGKVIRTDEGGREL